MATSPLLILIGLFFLLPSSALCPGPGLAGLPVVVGSSLIFSFFFVFWVVFESCWVFFWGFGGLGVVVFSDLLGGARRSWLV